MVHIAAWLVGGILAAVPNAPADTAPPARGLVAEYRFEKLDGQTVPDQQGRWPGRVVGEVRLAEGRHGQALALDGKGYVEIPGSDKPVYERGLSVEAWIRPERLAAGRIVDRSTPATSDSFCLDTHPGDAIRLITPAGTIHVEKVLALGRWTHVVAVYDPEGGELAVYLDGKLAAAQPSGSPAKIGGPNTVHIGADTKGGNRFSGHIDDVRLYDFALLDEAAAARFAGQEPKHPAVQEQSRPVHYRDGLHADSARLLARNDVVYLSPAVHEHEAMPVGNGRLCGMVWNADGLNLQLNHANNVWHQNSSGRVRLSAQPGFVESPQQFEQRLSLYDGAVRTTCRGAAGQWTAATRVLADRDVVAIRLEGRLPPEIQVDLEQWRPTAQSVVAGQAAGFVEDLPVPSAPQFARRMAIVAQADCPAVLLPVRSAGDLRTITMKLSPPRDAKGEVRLTVYVANPVVAAAADVQAAAAQLLADAQAQGWQPQAARAAQRWREFWAQSLLQLHSPDGRADYMENLWHLHLYWMGCGGEGESAVKFNGGPFLMHRDSRSWGTSYWYQNTRELYWCLPAANHLSLCVGLQRLYLATVPAHRQLARDLFGKRGLQIEETMNIAGPGDKRGNPYTMLYLSTGLECALQLYHQAVFARDDRLLREEVLPLMKEAVDFYMHYATLGTDGRYHIAPEDARETYWRVQDGMTSISALREAIPVLLRESARLRLFGELPAKWHAWLERLAPLPQRADGQAYAPCVIPPQVPPSDNATVNRLYPPERTSTSLTKRFNGENVEVDLIFPFGQAGIASPNHAQAKRTYFERTFQGSYGWDWSPVCAARLGLGDEAARLQAEHCRHTQHWPQGFWDSPASPYWAGGLVDCPYFDSPGVNAATTAEMLLQSYDGTIRVWPAAPRTWCGVFRLRAETGFMVISERAAGQVRYVAIESLFGGACRLINPWSARARVTQNGRSVAETDAAEITFATAQGQTYLVERQDAPVAQFDFAPLAPEPNADVKYMARPRRGSAPPVPRPGLPMLGITRDGWTCPRVAAEENRVRAAKAIRAAVGGRTKLAGVHVQALNAQGQASAAAWLSDGVHGTANIPWGSHSIGCLAELPAPTAQCVLVWSCDRTGQRQDGLGPVGEIAVETSADGQAWSSPVKQAVRGGDQHGQAVPITAPQPFRWLRVKHLGADGNPRRIECDEIEVFAGPALAR
jgi:hypothetical protein